MSIIVFGSINMDLVAQVKRLPAPAETLIGKRFFSAPGGKGANQAVATARLGATTVMVGRVGNDEFGAILKQNLADAGVQTETIACDPTVSSGVALIAVEESGQNNIIVVPGANGQIDHSDLARLEYLLPTAKLLLLQLEIPLDMTLAAISLARKHKLAIILDPAPVCELPASLYPQIDILTPNEVEAAQLVGFPINNQEDAQRAADKLLLWGVKNVIIKLGAAGVVYASREPELHGFVPPFIVDTIDTVAAGDAFNGGLAVALSEGLELPKAVCWGAAAGALSTTKAGAQNAMPRRADILTLLSS